MKPRGSRPCEIVFYAGAKDRETPRAIRVEGREIPVERVLGRRRLMDASTGEVVEEFLCRLEGGTARILVSDRGCTLVVRERSPGAERRPGKDAGSGGREE